MFLNKIFSKLFLIFSIFLLAYIFYRSEVFWDGTRSSYYSSYYFLSIILVIFSIISFFLNEIINRYFSIILFSTALSFYSFEAYLNYQFFKKYKIYKKEMGINYDMRSKLEIYNDLNKENNYVVDVGGKYYFSIEKKENLLPLSGISNSKTIHCNENGYYSIYDSDRFGFNNFDELWDEDNIEYLIVGDSFVHGNCVNRPNDISSVLRKLSNKPVLNIGYEHNRGPLIEYASLREYLKPGVKKVIWVYFEGNDLIDLKNELNSKILRNYMEDLKFTQNLKSKQNKIDKIAKNIIESKKIYKIEHNSFLKFFKLDNSRTLLKQITSPQPQPLLQPEFKEILKLANELVLKNNSKFYFIYLPEYERFKKNYNNKIYLSVKKIINELNITFIDINHEVFKKESNPLKLFPFNMPGHYNVEGYKKVAGKIYELTKN